jgi:hypothetical protein
VEIPSSPSPNPNQTPLRLGALASVSNTARLTRTGPPHFPHALTTQLLQSLRALTSAAHPLVYDCLDGVLRPLLGERKKTGRPKPQCPRFSNYIHHLINNLEKTQAIPRLRVPQNKPRMATTAQIQANQQNATYSTGPQTPEGKAAASQNARSHGYYAKRLYLSEEDQAKYNQLESQLNAEINPQGIEEQTALKQLLHALWLIEPLRDREAYLLHVYLQSGDPADEKLYQRLARARRSAQSDINRARQLLKTLQENRVLAQLAQTPLAVPRTFPLAPYFPASIRKSAAAQNALCNAFGKNSGAFAKADKTNPIPHPQNPGSQN